MPRRNIEEDSTANRTFRSQVRLNLKESDIVHEQADKCGQSIQLWLRYAVMRACGVEPEPPFHATKKERSDESYG